MNKKGDVNISTGAVIGLVVGGILLLILLIILAGMYDWI